MEFEFIQTTEAYIRVKTIFQFLLQNDKLLDSFISRETL